MQSALFLAPADNRISRSILCNQYPLKTQERDSRKPRQDLLPGLHHNILSSSFFAANAPAAGKHVQREMQRPSAAFTSWYSDIAILIIVLTKNMAMPGLSRDDVCATWLWNRSQHDMLLLQAGAPALNHLSSCLIIPQLSSDPRIVIVAMPSYVHHDKYQFGCMPSENLSTGACRACQHAQNAQPFHTKHKPNRFNKQHLIQQLN